MASVFLGEFSDNAGKLINNNELCGLKIAIFTF